MWKIQLLEAMFMWNINDFPTYDLFIGCVIKGHSTCLLVKDKRNWYIVRHGSSCQEVIFIHKVNKASMGK
jgi:hypothetical protein